MDHIWCEYNNLKNKNKEDNVSLIKRVKVQLGEYNIIEKQDCEKRTCADPVQTFDPEEIVIPKEYNEPKMKHDIALIKLKTSVIFTSEWLFLFYTI